MPWQGSDRSRQLSAACHHPRRTISYGHSAKADLALRRDLTMQPIPPFWFVQRQAKLEPAGESMYKATAPNLREAFLAIRQGVEARWSAALRLATDGPDV